MKDEKETPKEPLSIKRYVPKKIRDETNPPVEEVKAEGPPPDLPLLIIADEDLFWEMLGYGSSE